MLGVSAGRTSVVVLDIPAEIRTAVRRITFHASVSEFLSLLNEELSKFYLVLISAVKLAVTSTLDSWYFLLAVNSPT